MFILNIGFLFAGVCGVISIFWEVDDLVFCIFFIIYYWLWVEGIDRVRVV